MKRQKLLEWSVEGDNFFIHPFFFSMGNDGGGISSFLWRRKHEIKARIVQSSGPSYRESQDDVAGRTGDLRTKKYVCVCVWRDMCVGRMHEEEAS